MSTIKKYGLTSVVTSLMRKFDSGDEIHDTVILDFFEARGYSISKVKDEKILKNKLYGITNEMKEFYSLLESKVL